MFYSFSISVFISMWICYLVANGDHTHISWVSCSCLYCFHVWIQLQTKHRKQIWIYNSVPFQMRWDFPTVQNINSRTSLFVESFQWNRIQMTLKISSRIWIQREYSHFSTTLTKITFVFSFWKLVLYEHLVFDLNSLNAEFPKF